MSNEIGAGDVPKVGRALSDAELQARREEAGFRAFYACIQEIDRLDEVEAARVIRGLALIYLVEVDS